MQNRSARSSVISQLSEDYDDGDTLSISGAESENTGEVYDDSASNLGESHVEEKELDSPGQIKPMFLHLTCSCHYKSVVGSAIRPVSVTTLPTCLGRSPVCFSLECFVCLCFVSGMLGVALGVTYRVSMAQSSKFYCLMSCFL